MVRHTTLLKLPITLLFIATLLSCAGTKSKTAVPPENIRLFPQQDVCNYPANASAKIFHNLGGGTWAPLSPKDAQSGYACSGGQSNVQIFSPPGSSINVGYLAVGNERGSNMITLEYSAIAPRPVDNESIYRTVYLNFVGDIIKQALKVPMTDLIRKKTSNLASYFKAGRAEEETFDIGDGFVILIRENDEAASTIKVTARIYPDKALKLDAANP